MHFFQNTGAIQKSLDSGFQITRYVLTASLAVSLILAWIMTAWIFRLGIYFSDMYHARAEQK